MNLNRVRSSIRPVLSLHNEYRLRSVAAAVLPLGEPRVRRSYHFCNWKTGSQWVRLVLSDPRFQRESGLAARLHHNGVGETPELVPHQFPRAEHFIATPLFAGSEHLDQIGATAKDRAVFVTRHPRDLLVSFYFTNLQNHPLNDVVAERRRELEAIDTEAGLLRTMDHGFDEMIRIGDTWAGLDATDAPCPIRVFRYEALRGDRAEPTWTDLLEHLSGRPVDASLVRRLLGTYSARSMQGRSPETTKLRDRSTAGWEHHFTDRVEREFRSRYADVEQRWGYRSPVPHEKSLR